MYLFKRPSDAATAFRIAYDAQLYECVKALLITNQHIDFYGHPRNADVVVSVLRAAVAKPKDMDWALIRYRLIFVYILGVRESVYVLVSLCVHACCVHACVFMLACVRERVHAVCVRSWICMHVHACVCA